jgi:SAM-dependent methyltransferase
VPEPKLYASLADWWPLLSAPADYAEEAALYRRVILEACQGECRAILELGSGGGNNASHLKAHFALTLVDRSPGMLEVSRKLNPECEHIEADMRHVRVGRQFDAVFVHDAVAYMTTLVDVAAVAETAFIHCRPGGVALFAPDFVRETFRATTDCGGEDGSGRGLRYVEWTWDPDPSDHTYIVDFAYLLRERDGTIRVEHDRHLEGLFPRDEWRSLLETAGFDVSIVPGDLSVVAPGQYELFVCRRPAEPT